MVAERRTIRFIHGDEPAGRRVTDALLQAPLPDDVQLIAPVLGQHEPLQPIEPRRAPLQ